MGLWSRRERAKGSGWVSAKPARSCGAQGNGNGKEVHSSQEAAAGQLAAGFPSLGLGTSLIHPYLRRNTHGLFSLREQVWDQKDGRCERVFDKRKILG